ncbi:DNA polymerase subunit beta [Methanimicrococcus blatticola]|uniref:Polymerase nucleotidyl transferase domain-containing protein n=1 Tax=Methanimicrococcus blatticola TaxID=91560 RepID=A0A484F3P3_9EURY|nr:DNA polymerase subunit beta [Methanimicrococcus blatticola]MBZ3936051.1 DNA polymerase subunit beta [Methanimicrococcus blatticola]MCC2509337.1 DNA polymerase subunit beta [Methanimicrococcus blatticola]TDQ68223.1 hypothetical protein C7391_1161 [Methanimicrococcus blatticola]
MIQSKPEEFKDPILRDFFVTKNGLIFSVPDYFHPPEGIRSVLRYIPDVNGPRVSQINGKRYRKAEFNESFDYLKEKHPDWVFDVAIVPRSEIIEILKPNAVVKDILSGKRKNSAAFELIHRFMEAGISADAMGITGSILAGLENDESDIDFLVYGTDWIIAKDVLTELKKEDADKTDFRYQISDLDNEMWHTVYKKRKSPLSFNDFFNHEIRKGNRGMFVGAGADGKNVYFDLLFARSKDQLQSTTPIQRGTDTEKIIIEAVVTNADFAFDSPAIYLINHDEIDEIYSYTHTYAGQALAGEKIRARGIVEVIGNKKRLVIGTSREAEDEWMISLSLLEAQDIE